MAAYEYAIEKKVLNNGKEMYTPLVRRKSKFLPIPWERICCIYGVYMTMNLDFHPELTQEECVEHIKAYQQRVENSMATNVKHIEYIDLETIEANPFSNY